MYNAVSSYYKSVFRATRTTKDLLRGQCLLCEHEGETDSRAKCRQHKLQLTHDSCLTKGNQIIEPADALMAQGSVLSNSKDNGNLGRPEGSIIVAMLPAVDDFSAFISKWF